MQRFKYTAVTLSKRKYNGIMDAEDEGALAKELLRQNLYLVRAKAIKSAKVDAVVCLERRPAVSEFVAFCRRFAIMLGAGVPIVESLKLLGEHSFSKQFKRTIVAVTSDVTEGILLSDACARHPHTFHEYFCSMVKIGEEGGSLDETMLSVADYYENDSKVRAKVKSSLAYPALLFSVTVCVLVALTFFVIPAFRSSLAELDVEMPKLTMLLFNISGFALRYWKELLIGAFAFSIVLFLLGRTRSGKYFYDTLAVNLPMLRHVARATLASRFARGFGILLRSGMAETDALDTIVGIMGNKNIERKMSYAIADIKSGVTMTLSFKKYRIFPPMLIKMLDVGENTGEMDEVLLRSCSYFDSEVENTLTTVTSLIQPVVLLILGVTIAVAFAAIYAPIISVIQTL